MNILEKLEKQKIIEPTEEWHFKWNKAIDRAIAIVKKHMLTAEEYGRLYTYTRIGKQDRGELKRKLKALTRSEK